MSGAKGGEENSAGASAATVQQAGIALGAAIAGLVANASGLDNSLDAGSVFARVALGSLGARRGTSGSRCDRRAIEPDVPRSPEQGLTARVCASPKPAEPEPNKDFERAPPSAVRAILDDLPIHIRPNLPAARVQT